MAKSILIISINSSFPREVIDESVRKIKDDKDEDIISLRNDYHIIVTSDILSSGQGFKFEVLNADKLEEDKVLETIEQLKTKLKLCGK